VTKPELIEETARHYQLANEAFSKDDWEIARQHYEAALNLVPNFAEALHNLGDLLLLMGKISAAMDCYERALASKPQSHKTRYSLATAQLMCGNFAEGWKNYEARWANKNLPHPGTVREAALWDGSPVQGKLLLWGEQGIGDEVMFAGFLPEIIARGVDIVLKCANPRLIPLFKRSFPQVEVVHELGMEKFAAHRPMGDLPMLLHPDLSSYSAPKYYLKAVTPQKDAGKKRIGISWHSNSTATGRYRSISLTQLNPLFALSGIEWLNLQYGDVAELENQAAAANAPLVFDADVNPLADLDHFAAQVASLDGVITIDNATAHIAGALGIPTYVLLPHTPDWRWFLNRKDTPWYPSMKLFRQSQLHDWDSAIRALQQEMTSGD